MTSLSVNPTAVLGEEFLEPAGFLSSPVSPCRRIDPVDVEVRRAAAQRADRVAIGVVRQGADQHAKRDLERLRGVKLAGDPS